MTEAVQLVLLGAGASVGPLVLGVLTLGHQWYAEARAQARDAKAEIGRQELRAGVGEIKKATDGMKDALVRATQISAHAEGVTDEHDRALAEAASNDKAVADSKLK